MWWNHIREENLTLNWIKNEMLRNYYFCGDYGSLWPICCLLNYEIKFRSCATLWATNLFQRLIKNIPVVFFNSDISSLEEELKTVTAALVEEFLEPEKNNLIQRSV